VRQIVDDLAVVPGSIAALVAGQDGARLTARADPKAWSASDVLAHLRSCAEVRGKWFTAMLERDHPTVRAVSPRSAFRNYVDRDVAASLLEFTAEREALVARLRGLDADGWARGLTFTGASPRSTELTVATCATGLLGHELIHVEQIGALLG
jgi:hypothetical protein